MSKGIRRSTARAAVVAGALVGGLGLAAPAQAGPARPQVQVGPDELSVGVGTPTAAVAARITGLRQASFVIEVDVRMSGESKPIQIKIG